MPSGTSTGMLLTVSVGISGSTSVSAQRLCRSRSAGSAGPGARRPRLGHELLDFVEVVRAPLDGHDRACSARGVVDRIGVGVEGGVDRDLAAPEGVVRAGQVLVDADGRPLAGATASTTEDGPVTASPPAKIHFTEVWPVTGLASSQPCLRGLDVDAVEQRLAVERLADGHDDLVGLDDEVGVAAGHGTAAAGAVELAQRHRQALDAGQRAGRRATISTGATSGWMTTPSCSASSISSA